MSEIAIRETMTVDTATLRPTVLGEGGPWDWRRYFSFGAYMMHLTGGDYPHWPEGGINHEH